jgi:hypothetical protein
VTYPAEATTFCQNVNVVLHGVGDAPMRAGAPAARPATP